jgi:hypothetical protein
VLRFSTYELKSDEQCQTTGNLFIEFEQKGRPSGIAVTEAECWATQFRHDCYVLVPTRQMKKLCEREKRIVRGGDYDNYRGYLVPWMDLLKAA